MKRDTAVDLILGRLGRPKAVAMRDTVISEISTVITTQLEEEPELPWFLLSNPATVTVATEESVALPEGFLLEWEDSAFTLTTDTELTFLERDDLDTIKLRYGNTSGQPKFYDLVGDEIIFRPIPNAAYTFNLWCFMRDTDISGVYGDGNNIENGWLKNAPALVIAETCAILAANHLRSPQMAQTFQGQAQVARSQLMKKNVVRMELNKQRYMEG